MMSSFRPLWLLFALTAGVAAIGLWAGALAAAGSSAVLIESVLYDGYALNDADEAVRLANVGDAAVDIGGWKLSDGSATATLPATTLAPGETLWLTQDAAAFRDQFGYDAGLTLRPWPGFANAGDEVLLYDASGALVDALVYLDGDATHQGWHGPSVAPYRVPSVFGAEGQILYRKRDQRTGRVIPDTDTAADWAQSTGDVVDGRKVRYPGWETERFFFPAVITATSTLTVAVAPDNAYDTLSREVANARASVRLASLMLENVAFGEELAAAARRGVEVTALLEGDPPGGITDQERYICGLIDAAGGACWFMFSDSTQRINDRYSFMHAKYLIIDDRVAAIGSENFSPDSLPNDDKSDGTWGRRGVFLLTDAPGVVAHLSAVFAADLDPLHYRDLRRWSADDPKYGPPPPGYLPPGASGGSGYAVRFPEPATFHGEHTFEIVQSPENSLRDVDSLLGLIGRAGQGDQLFVQQLSERPFWGATFSNSVADPNPRLEAYIAAARRGATVRLLLDSYFDTPKAPTSNAATCIYVNIIAERERLALRCEVGNLTGLGIHNKMVLARIGGRGYVHVGSINGTEVSSKGNREVALQVQSDEAFDYLAGMFLGDAAQPVYVPIALSGFRGAVDHLLISEIVYDPPGAEDLAEFVELANPTGAPIDLTGYALGDAVTPNDFEDRLFFPTGTIIPPNGTLVVTISAVAFRAEYRVEPDLEILESDPNIPNMIDDLAWGDPKGRFQLGNQADEVLLWRGSQVVDLVAWGDKGDKEDLPGVARCPSLEFPNRSLERYPWWDDTDVCPHDFRPWPYPSPGRVP